MSQPRATFALELWLLLLVLLTLPAAAGATGSVYVASFNGFAPGTLAQFAIGTGGLLSPLTPATVATGTQPTDIVVTPDGKSVYVTNPDCFRNLCAPGAISQYSVDPLSDALTPKTPATVTTGLSPRGLAVTPDGRFVYVTNAADNTILQYGIDSATGALTQATSGTVTTKFPGGLAVAADGRSLYATNEVGNTVSQYDIDRASGALTAKSPATVATGAGPFRVAVTGNGRSAYVLNGTDNTVSQYTVDPVSGALSPKVTASVAAGSFPDAIAVTPNSQSVYVTNEIDRTVSQYTVDTVSGALSPKAPPSVPTDLSPGGIAVTPDGKNAYVTNSAAGNVSQYSIDQVSGDLTAKTPATVPATNPIGIAVGPLPAPARHATATTVRCSPVTIAPGDATVCTATVTDTASAGRSTPTGRVTFTNSGAGTFFGSPCTLSGNGGSASCAVFFSSFQRGGRMITASYSGDTTHDKSTGATLVAVAVPASTDGCLVFGHGRITAANGDRASFRGLAVASPPRGAELFRDNGRANAFRLVSTSVDAVACSANASRASMFGTAKLKGAGSVEYRIDVQLGAWEWGKDSYRIRLSNGYDSGAQPIRHGDLDIRLRSSEHEHHDVNANHTRGGQQDGG